MQVLHSSEPFDEIKMSGTDSEWAGLALALGRDGAEVDCEPVADPAPYDGCVMKIRVKHDPGEKVRIGLAPDGVLVIQGGLGPLGTLAENMASFGDQCQAGAHMHIDYVSENHYVGRDTASVVLMHLGKST